MERQEALQRIGAIIGTDLRPLAESLGVTIEANGHINKGWVGHTIERVLGLPLNSLHAPNFGSWELKVVPLRRRGTDLVVKETMAITMLDPVEVVAKEFEDSFVLAKLRKIVVASRIFENVQETSPVLDAVTQFDLDNPAVYAQVKADYHLIRGAIRTLGREALTGKMGVLIQPRTKGAGHGSTSRAFYARTRFVAHILGIAPLVEYQAPIVADHADDEDTENDVN